MKLQQLRKILTQSDESGFTIIESLVALLVAAILLASVSPVLVISTATRVQARRVELAAQAAKTFIDGVRTKTITEPTEALTALSVSTTRTVSSSTSDYLVSSAAVPTDTTKLYCFNKDGSIAAPGCTSNLFYIQAVKLQVSGSDPDKGQGYRLGIRIYRSDAQFGSLIKTSDSNGSVQTAFTGGVGNRRTPLLEMTTEITRGLPSYSALCDRLGGCK
ncbi:hormogonium polysaccharide secretion pseudopilin HpsB [Calothrix sp. 336/3]|uniref:hormogonium polysaccharide secretion pseudopilin HpsB n=1 Tax=Calothrix sp. 336/3 TaxID=1337936 RepID=UPI0004E45279|nr:hormogonium polysaccharide secretion pseudopilin HpsB [Calothrix sp. 336/3]AKG23334.1 hypothetical protein IJ00_20440 [Calothrix sp. 336/3]